MLTSSQSNSLRLNQLDEWVRQLIAEVKVPAVVLLSGDLGAGKSLLVKKMVKSLGGSKSNSPTYSLINEYSAHGTTKLFHVDLYRLEDDEDLESVGFWDLFENENAIVFIEWSDRLDKDSLPLAWSKVSIDISKVEDESSRTYLVSR